MKSLIVLLFFVGMMPLALVRPHVGVLAWALSGLMNPHRLFAGPAYSFPFSMMIGGVTLLSFFAHPQDRRPMPWSAPVVILVMLIVWMNVTTVFALHPENAWPQWDKVMKILLMVLVAMKLIHTKTRIITFTVLVTLAIAFYGIKGGIFTILTGGQHLVVGVPNSLLGGNTEISLAQLMIFSGMVWMLQMVKAKWLKLALLGCMLAIAAAIIGSYSRGAFVAGGAMLVFLWWKSERKMPALIAIVVVVPLLLSFMPEKYHAKMSTIESYEEDGSAMGRINAWWFAFHLANDYPFTGGGFNTFTKELFLIYAPEPEDFHVAHSIWFQILGHHGYPGLILFIALGVTTWFMAGATARMARDREDMLWAERLAKAMQIALIGYAAGGTFLSLAYLDLYYYHVTIVVALNRWVKEAIVASEAEAVESEGVELSPKSGGAGQPVAAGGFGEGPAMARRTLSMRRPAGQRGAAAPSPRMSGNPLKRAVQAGRKQNNDALPLRGRQAPPDAGAADGGEERPVSAFGFLAKALELNGGGTDAKPADAARPLAGRRRASPRRSA